MSAEGITINKILTKFQHLTKLRYRPRHLKIETLENHFIMKIIVNLDLCFQYEKSFYFNYVSYSDLICWA